MSSEIYISLFQPYSNLCKRCCKLEHLKAECTDDTKGGILMRLECESEDVKNECVKAINSEVKHLRSTAKSISNQFWII